MEYYGACGSIKWKKDGGCKTALNVKMLACDDYCNLCNCTTDQSNANDPVERCNGILQGECQATCDDDTCYNVKCKCNYGWTGDKCDIPRKYYEIIL